MALDTDDLEPRPKVAPAVKDLSALSVTELQEYISYLETEIVRTRAAIDAKQAFRNVAETFFKR